MDLNEILIEAAKDGNMLVLKTCLEKGADVNASDKDGLTALMWAALQGHLDVANLLIEKGADVNVRNKNGWAALMWAAKNGHTEIVHFLKEKYAKEEAIEEKEEESEEEDFRDEEYDEAIDIIKREREISISKLQRRMRIGFNRAARIIEEMEKDGIIVKDPNSGKYIYKEEKRRRK